MEETQKAQINPAILERPHLQLIVINSNERSIRKSGIQRKKTVSPSPYHPITLRQLPINLETPKTMESTQILAI